MILHILGRQWLLMINIYFIFIIYVIDPHYIHLKIVEKVLIYHYVKLAAFKCKSEVWTVKNIIRKLFLPCSQFRFKANASDKIHFDIK